MEITLIGIWTFISTHLSDLADFLTVAKFGWETMVGSLFLLFSPIAFFWRRRQRRIRDARDTGRHKETHTKLDETRNTLNEIAALVRKDSTDADAPDPTEALKTLQAYDKERANQAFNVIEEDPSLADSLFEELLSEAENRIDKDRKQASRYSEQRGSLAFYSDTDKALTAYAKATELDPGNATAWNQLGRLQRRKGLLDAAEKSYNHVLSLGNQNTDKELEAVALGNLGIIAKARGDLDKAEDFQTRSLALNEEVGRKEGMANTLGNLGIIAETRGDLDTAQDFQTRALALHQELGHKEGMASALGNLGNIAEARGELDIAEDFYNRSLAHDEELGRKEGMAKTLGNLGLIAKARGDLDKAQDFQTRALALNEELGRKEGMANILGNLGRVAQTRGDLDKARDLWSQARDLFEEIGMPHLVKKLQGWIDSLDDEDSD